MNLKVLMLASLGAIVSLSSANAFAEDTAPYCREYTKTVTIDNKTQEAYGTACLQPDGSWKIVDGSEKIVSDDTTTTTPETKVIVVEKDSARPVPPPASFDLRFFFDNDRDFPRYHGGDPHHPW